MTKQEIQEKTQAKVMQLKELAQKLQIRVIAHNAITPGNIIKPMVYFDDMEEYQLDPLPEPITRHPKPDMIKIREKIKEAKEEGEDKTNVGGAINLENKDAEIPPTQQ